MRKPYHLHLLCFSALLAGLATADAIDVDGDLLSDVWEVKYGFTVGTGAPASEAATANPDGDQFDNQTEAEHGTDPNDATIFIGGSGVAPGVFSGEIVKMPTSANYRVWLLEGKGYHFSYTELLDVWIDLPTETVLLDGEYQVVILSADPLPSSLFWRIAIEDLPSTFPGVSRWEERILSTEQAGLDVDGDTLLNGWEIENGLNPGSDAGNDGASGDLDNDLLLNVDEQTQGTLANNPDTDADGLLDGNEIAQSRDPLSRDHPLVAVTFYRN